MMSSKKKNKQMSSASRIIIGSVVILGVIGTAIGIVYTIKKKSDLDPQVYVAAGPTIDARPGLGSPSKTYNESQLKENSRKAKEAQKELKSNVPTLTHSNYIGNVSSFIDSQPNTLVCPVDSKTRISDPTQCTVPNLILARKAGISAAELICKSCSVDSLRKAGYTIGDLKNGGHSAAELKEAGYTLPDLLKAGYNAVDLNKAGYSSQALQGAGLSASQLDANENAQLESLISGRDSCVSAKQFLSKGISPAELKKSGYTSRQLLSSGVGVSQLKSLGFTLPDLARAGFNKKELINAGFPSVQVAKQEPTINTCSVSSLEGSHGKGIPIRTLLQTCKAEALRASGYSLAEMKKAGVPPLVLRQSGFCALQLHRAGYDAKSLVDASYTPKSLKSAGFTATELIAAGEPAALLVDAGYSRAQLKDAGVDADALIRSGAKPAALKGLGYTATELAAAGSTAGRLRAGGYTAKDLREAGFTASQLRQAGFSAKDLRGAGYKMNGLKVAGYTTGDLLRAGFNANQLGSSSAAQRVNTTRTPAVTNTLASSAPVNVANLPSISNPSGQVTAEDRALARLNELQKYQQAQLDQAEQNNMLSKMESKISSQAQKLMSGWNRVTPQAMTIVTESTIGGTLSAAKQALVAKEEAAAQEKANNPTIKAGTVMYAVLSTSINSDEKTPIMAKIISGELAGAKLIGTFKRVDTKVLLTFNVMNIESYKNTISFNAVAIDPATARTALSGDVNNHYMKKYGTVFASAFLAGLGKAVQGGTSNCQLSLVNGGSDPWCQTIYNKLNVTQSILTGVGDAGNTFASTMKKEFGDIPPTITVPGGTAFGLLFMSDLNLPEPLKKENLLTTMNDLSGEQQ